MHSGDNLKEGFSSVHSGRNPLLKFMVERLAMDYNPSQDGCGSKKGTELEDEIHPTHAMTLSLNDAHNQLLARN